MGGSVGDSARIAFESHVFLWGCEVGYARNKSTVDEIPLTQEQRKLVEDNIGLVMVHLRRHVGYIPAPKRDREWEDLVQEGCLGLIKAAVGFRKQRGIPFAAYALPRIHNAVSRAIHRKFSTVAIPIQRGAKTSSQEDSSSAGAASRRPKVCSLSPEHAEQIADHRACNPADNELETVDDGPKTVQQGSVAANDDLKTGRDGEETVSGCAESLCGRAETVCGGFETVGDRLREKYERAARRASATMSCGTSTRGDRAKLVKLLLEERFLIPHEESRRALRQIARDTKSSYARVAQCEKQLQSNVRRRLEDDPEFEELRSRARTDPRGSRSLIDDSFDQMLASRCANTLVERIDSGSPQQRDMLLRRLWKVSGRQIEAAIRHGVSKLKPRARERLLDPAEM